MRQERSAGTFPRLASTISPREPRFGRPGGWLDEALAISPGIEGHEFLPRETGAWLSSLRPEPPKHFRVHDDRGSHELVAALGVRAFAHDGHIFLGSEPRASLDAILRHELVHLAQMQLAGYTGRIATRLAIEREADDISARARGTVVRFGADPCGIYPIVWFIAIGVGLYVLLRPGNANAPGPGDVTLKSPSAAQIVGEAICIFAIPGGAFALGPRLGLGFLGSAALAGAAGNVGLRAVSDAARGGLSPPLMYLFDAGTGALIGFIVPGGVRLIGQAGTKALDALATYGLRASDVALTRVLAQAAAETPLTAEAAQKVLQARGLAGQVSKWWLDRRGVMLLYRGQELATDQILSPLARTDGIAASRELVTRLRSLGMSSEEIAGYTARWYTQPVPPLFAPPGMAGVPLGAAGIPTSQIPGIAANFGEGGIIYVIRVPQSLALRPIGWQGLQVESERVILNQVPPGSIVQAIPASKVAPLMVDESGLLVPGK